MIDLTGAKHHPVIEDIVSVLCNKTQNNDKGFFRAEIAYFLGKVAGSMRASVRTKHLGNVPINIYTLALATSGYGKGYSVNIIENKFLRKFKKRFVDTTFHEIAQRNLLTIADDRAISKGTQQHEELEKVEKEFDRAGPVPFTFDSGTAPAVKQLREKLLMGKIGAMNLQIDEIGSNLIGQTEMLNVFLELYDQGLIKSKLVKNTQENLRAEELDGKTPCNMLLFGTPSKLLDGSTTENEFYSFLDTGYARRCIFGFGRQVQRAGLKLSAVEIYNNLTKPSNNALIDKWADHFAKLADPAMFDWEVNVPDDVAIRLLEYKIACEMASDNLPEHREIQKAELSHRYFKALKLAGAYAFIDQATDMHMDHLMSAILLVEESGNSFEEILNREKTYVKLAKFIATTEGELTHADLNAALPFYKMSTTARNELMMLGMAWGYKNHIVIKKQFVDGIEFFSGETLKETDIDNMILAYSDNFAYNYRADTAPFDKLDILFTHPDMHWINHHAREGHRNEEKIIPGRNMIVIDVDGETRLETVHELLKDYKFITYTTKRHTEDEHRFRLVMPINYVLELTADEYKGMMDSFLAWLPFQADPASNQRSKKWMAHAGGKYHLNNGEGTELLDVLPFIPKTTRNEAFREGLKPLESLDNLERWFAQRMVSGNRNNHMIKFALALVDAGMPLVEVSQKVHAFNSKLNEALPSDEIDNTVMVTVGKRYTQ